jgi:hypothetical protein
MEEKGSWDNAWFDPEGKFDWSKIDRFEIVPEHQSLENITFSFDDINVSGEEITVVTSVEEDIDDPRLILSPNPMTDYTQIEYCTDHPGLNYISIYNVTGQKIVTFGFQSESGHHKLTWNGQDARGERVSKGLYIVRMETSKSIHTAKLLIH